VAGAEAGGRVAEDGAQIAREAGLRAEPIAIEATPPVWKTIVETADLHVGSVSNAVVHHTEPTLVIHHAGDDDDRPSDDAD
jgi:hypothetical protein